MINRDELRAALERGRAAHTEWFRLVFHGSGPETDAARQQWEACAAEIVALTTPAAARQDPRRAR